MTDRAAEVAYGLAQQETVEAPEGAPLAFDARYARGSGERPLPMTLIVSGVVLVVLVAALAFFYRGGIRAPGQAPNRQLPRGPSRCGSGTFRCVSSRSSGTPAGW